LVEEQSATERLDLAALRSIGREQVVFELAQLLSGGVGAGLAAGP
jgi:hypothetical protein